MWQRIEGIGVWLYGLVLAAGTGLVALLGGWDATLQVLMLLMILDYAAGVMHAILTHSLDSKIGAAGIFKKVGYLILVIVACGFDRAMGFQEPLARTIVLIFLIMNESLSILEHLGQFGVPIPSWLLERLKKLRDEADQGQLPGAQ